MRQSFGSTLLATFLFALLIFTLSQRPAYAYIDIGTASFVIQFLFAGFFGSLLALTIFWKRVTGSFARLASRLTGTKNDSRDDNFSK